MYKKLSEWQQQRRAELAKTKNEHGVDPTTWAPAPPPEPKWAVPDEFDDALVELAKLRVEATEIKNEVLLSQQRYNGRTPGKGLSSAAYSRLVRRKSEIASRIARLEARCAAERAAKRVIKAQAIKASLAETFMDMAQQMLADEVYQRVLIAAVHRHQSKVEAA